MTKYELIRTADELRKAIDTLTSQPVVGLDTETTELDPYTSRLRLIQLAAPDRVYIIDFDKFADADTRKSEALEPLRRLLAAPRPIKIAHNAKFDAKFLKHNLGIDLGGLFDTLLASQLVGAGDIEERHGLETVAERYLNELVDKSERLSNWNLELTEAQLEYAARDAAILLPLREKLIERLKSESLVRVAQLEFECVMPVVDIELAGFFMHKDRWLEQLGIVEKR
ncbi:MAG TPA: ribonuclease D, partial [Pyrinomonadaceae bacterium]